MAYPPGKAPPYTYDDPRIFYDEECFFYDGGYDEICLIDNNLLGNKKIGGSGGIGRRRPYVPPPAPNPLLDIKIKVCLKCVNDEPVESQCSQMHWVRELENVVVDTHFSKHEKTKRFVYTTLANAQALNKFVSAELTSAQTVEKSTPNITKISVVSSAPKIRIVNQIKKSIHENKIFVSTSKTTKQPNKIYLKKTIVVIPKKSSE